MNTFFCLSVICAVLAICHGACFLKKHAATIKDGELVVPKVCVDIYDGQEHPIGDKWNTAECMECTCGESEMQCCTRYGGVAHVEGCVAKVNEETCQFQFFKADDPSKPC